MIESASPQVFPPATLPPGLLTPSPLFEGRPDPRVDPAGWVASKLPEGWDWLRPDYDAIRLERVRRLSWLREDRSRLAAALHSYAQPWGFYDFIFDWGDILDPRLGAFGMEIEIPFVLFPRQVEALTWFEGMYLKPGLGLDGKGNFTKTRGCGFSTLACFYALYRWRFRKTHIGFGSNLERNVYASDNPKSLFWKLKHGIEAWPEEFWPKGFAFSKHMLKGEGAGKLVNPDSGSTITGDAGDEIGRGDRKDVYFVDEHASLQRPHAAEAGLSKATNTLIRGSTEKRDSLFNFQKAGLENDNPANLFTFDWWQDPRYTQELHDREKATAESQGMGDIFAAEVDRDVERSAAETFIPRDLLRQASKRNPPPFGPVYISIDVASSGRDNSVISWRRALFHGPQEKIPYSDILGTQIGEAVVALAEKFMRERVHVAAVIFELEGAGYAVNAYLAGTGLASVLRPIHPGARTGQSVGASGRHFNVRAQCWDHWKTALINGANCPDDELLIHLGSAIRSEWRKDAEGRNVLLLEDKKTFRKRLSADPDNPFGGPSPDEADGQALLHRPVVPGELDWASYRRAIGRAGEEEEMEEEGGSWGWS